jgi:hypothetical protein
VEELEKMWASGRPLFDVFEEIKRLETKAVKRANVRTAHLAELVERNAWMRTIQVLRRKLMVGELFGYGLCELDEETRELQAIPSSFWKGAEFDPLKGGAWVPGQSYLEISISGEWDSSSDRVALEDHDSIEDNVFSRGPKSQKPIRQQAISACHTSGLVKFERDDPEIRHQQYMDWIALNRPKTDTRSKFGWKAFEGDETEYKRSVK